MAILAACGTEGLLAWDGGWRRTACPLRRATLLTPCGCPADTLAKLLWDGARLLPMPPGAEAVMRWQRTWLALSGEADGLWVMDERGQLLICAPCGVYPQDMCFAGNDLAVCGGADSRVHMLSLPSAQTLRAFSVPGNVQRIAAQGEQLCVLSAIGEEHIRCLVGVISLRTGRYEPLMTLPGLPGAVCAAGRGAWWIAASERLCLVDCRGRVLRMLPGQGLIRSLCLRGDTLLAADPVLGACTLLDLRGQQTPVRLAAGDVHMAVMAG
ncbi:MAG: hypothetical protein IKK21_10490 [Clostridia bacterium]|nr:hypothetical protein [Clostridia bacterium]